MDSGGGSSGQGQSGGWDPAVEFVEANEGLRNFLAFPVAFVSASNWLAQAIYVAAKLGIPDVLAGGPRAVSEIAADVGYAAETDRPRRPRDWCNRHVRGLDAERRCCASVQLHAWRLAPLPAQLAVVRAEARVARCHGSLATAYRHKQLGGVHARYRDALRDPCTADTRRARAFCRACDSKYVVAVERDVRRLVELPGVPVELK